MNREAGSETAGKVWGFFYGSYMNRAVLREVDVVPEHWEPALCYICPAMEPRPADGAHIDRIVGPAREHGFPAAYIDRLESFRR